MSFTVKCSKCNAASTAEDEWLGQEAECPGCGAMLIIKKAEASHGLSIRKTPLPKTGNMKKATVALSSDGQKACPNCQKPLSTPDAVICIECGSNLKTGEKISSGGVRGATPPLLMSKTPPNGFFGLLVEFDTDDVRGYQLPDELQKPLAVYFFGGDDEVNSGDSINKWVDSLSLRDLLLRGELTRHNRVRWVLPKPGFEQFYSESKENDEEARIYLRQAIQMWQQPQEWVAIGDGLAREFESIRILYDPGKVTVSRALGKGMQLGAYAGIFLAIILFIFYDSGWDFTQKGSVNTGSHGVSDGIFKVLLKDQSFGRISGRIVFTILIGLSAAGVFGVIGAAIGWAYGKMTYRKHRDTFPRPPDDGFQYKLEEKIEKVSEPVSPRQAPLPCPRCGKKLKSRESMICRSCRFKWFNCPSCGTKWTRGEENCSMCGQNIKNMAKN